MPSAFAHSVCFVVMALGLPVAKDAPPKPNIDRFAQEGIELSGGSLDPLDKLFPGHGGEAPQAYAW